MAIQIHYWTNDIEDILKYYIERLLFELVYKQPVNGSTNFCILGMNNSKIMFACSPTNIIDNTDRKDNVLLEKVIKRIGHTGPISVYISIDNVEDYYNLINKNGAEVIEQLWNTPWGLRQFTVVDPDGNFTTFHQDI